MYFGPQGVDLYNSLETISLMTRLLTIKRKITSIYCLNNSFVFSTKHLKIFNEHFLKST